MTLSHFASGTIARPCIALAARDWLATPFVHRASVRGEGCDCVGLIRGIWREFAGPEPWTLPPYAPGPGLPGEAQALRDVLETHFRPRNPGVDPALGDVVVLRLPVRNSVSSGARHLGICVAEDRFIHAYWGRAVVESRWRPFWAQNCVACFGFPFAEAT